MTRVSQLFIALALSIACIHAQTQCDGVTCNDSTQYCGDSPFRPIGGLGGLEGLLGMKKPSPPRKVCRDYGQLKQDCTGGSKCAPGLKCDFQNSGNCIPESTVVKCTSCGLIAGSNGPCCAPALRSTEAGKECYCATGKQLCFSNSECQFSGGCCNQGSRSCTSDQNYC